MNFCSLFSFLFYFMFYIYIYFLYNLFRARLSVVRLSWILHDNAASIIMTNTIVRFTFRTTPPRFRKFPVRAPWANPFLIPTATALNSSRCEFQERGESLPFYLHEILLRRESTRRSRAAARRKDIPRVLLVGLIERVPSQPYFHPSSHEVVNSRSPGRTSVNIDVNLEERENLQKRKRERERE